ncbi:protein adenylyltransferase SelO-like isoform X2 [Ptychodera flava]|uniref:protein adenylyltransferase SelO-like isoform X2 n=1 Tax=Ptychodera flava TaxID=63121 RepID=UPI00396A7072
MALSLSYFLPKLAVCLMILIILCIARTDSEHSCDDNESRLKYTLNESSHCRSVTDSDKHLIGSLEDWSFANSLLLDTFPIDKEKKNYVREVKDAIFSVVLPTPLQTPVKLVAVAHPVLEDILDLHPNVTKSEYFLAFVSGNTILADSTPLSHRYGGHQFGDWANQLGDGRAHLLGEYVNRKGERWELQLKGSGLTPYSRRGDGKAVLRSSVREFLCSEAMFYLGIPTSRAVSLVVSNDPVWRDQFYDGHPKIERAAVVLRLARSWFRIGSLEILAHKKETSLLRKVTDFVIEQYFPTIDPTDKNKYLALFSEIISQTADLIARWMAVGFAHGVMNTDNFSLLSITIDYGPFGFLDKYVPSFIPNTSDDEGRYSYQNQPDIGIFNMNQLRAALWSLMDREQKRQSEVVLRGYVDIYKRRFMELFRAKLGLFGLSEQDEYIVALLLKIMEDTKADFTMTFRQMADLNLRDIENDDIADELWALKDLHAHEQWQEWSQRYADRIHENGDEDTDQHRRDRMNAVNPRYVLRN